MRLLVVEPWGERLGGAEAMLQAVLDGAHESGHELELVFLQPGAWPAQLKDAGFQVHVLDAGRVRELHRFAITVARLVRIMRASRPELILGWSAKTQLYTGIAAALCGMRARNVWWQQAIPRRALVDVLATLLPAKAIACYSRAAAAGQARLRPRRRTFVVGAGSPPPPARSEPAALKLPEGVPVVGVVGRLQPWKGQDRLLRAQALLRERGHRAHTLVVGGDSYGLSPRYAASLRSLAQSLGLADAVTFTGEVPDAGPYIERMDILVNASDPEPFGIVLLEAMARGVAVTAVDSGGPSEFIENGRTGALARSGSPADLAAALEPLLAAPRLRRELGAAGLARYLQDFTDSAMRRRFFAAMEKLRAQS